MKMWRRHTLEFKRQVVERMKTCSNITELALELKIERKLLYVWRNQFEGRPEPRHANYGISSEERKEQRLQEEVTRLQAALGRKGLENDFLKNALLKVEPEHQASNTSGASASTPSFESRCRSKAR